MFQTTKPVTCSRPTTGTLLSMVLLIIIALLTQSNQHKLYT